LISKPQLLLLTPPDTPIIIGIVAAVGLGAYFLSGSGEKKVDKLEKQVG
jgi:hypothetical protein